MIDYTKFDMNMAISLAAMAQHEYNKLTPEEKQARKDKREKWEEEYRINKCIQQGKCSYCDSKLIRGKKDKHNKYIRTWTCSGCGSKFMR
ncbi:hypothetical protein ACR77J_07790 [Tissierella praeacuta]|uniref:hypothetical protein n=1 Tax=Tissierella praeacuta TaxID=43131 RepID=UPI003DA54D73